MALVSINQPSRTQEKEESPIDKILKGLQIVGAGASIYGTVKDIGLKQAQTDKGFQGVDATAPVAPEAAIRPDQVSNLTPEQQSNLIPNVGPQAPQSLLPELSPNRPNIPESIGGKLYTTEEGRAKALTLTNEIKKQYEASPQIAIFNQAELNHANAIRGLEQGGKEGHLLALNSIRALYQPGNTKAADGSNIANADSAYESLGKKIEEFRTGNKQVLDPNEVLNLSKLTGGAMSFYAKQAQKTGESTLNQAQRMGLPIGDIGIQKIDSAKYEKFTPPKVSGGKEKYLQSDLKAEQKKRGLIP